LKMKKILFLLCLACCASFLHSQHTQYTFSYDELLNRKAVELKANTGLINLSETGETYTYWLFKRQYSKDLLTDILSVVANYHDYCFFMLEDTEPAINTGLSVDIKKIMQTNKYYVSTTIISLGGMNVYTINNEEYYYQECVLVINYTKDFKTYEYLSINFSCYKR